MKNFLKHHGLWVLFAAAVIAVVMAVMSVFSNTSSPLANLTGILASPFRSAYTSIATWFNDKQNYYQDNLSLKEENAALRKQIAEMEAEIRQARLDSEENSRLKGLLNLRDERQDLSDFEAATITEHTVTNWTSSLTLDRGTAHGVEVQDCVIDETGALVGVISEVGYNWCTVLTIVDTDTSLGAQVFRTRDLGLANGDFSLMGENRLRLDYLPADSQLLSGDLVVTSGLGGYYPSGLVIGTIEEVQKDDSGAAAYAVLAPRVDFDQLTEVFIIKSFELVS
ncbi:rod shape-determining protein MreC [Oscillibacter sp. PC13]|uniref:rod shape-determining protein MreC n=1 Tax=Oscillibacter sp. PC13 TaxID=1855299 RepID=UPI0008E1609D|nr:rod shape-determining protein MreC [Oscillibacter sp. PC13]SFP78310.1 rod shape-determining protein MreC [Oscillibacter sp. PC13]